MNGLGRSNAFLSIALVCNFAALLPGPTRRSWCYLANARGGGGGGDTQRDEKGEREGRGRDEGAARGKSQGGRRLWRTRRCDVLWRASPAFQASVVELINIPFSLAIGICRSVFPRNKQTRHPMLRHGTGIRERYNTVGCVSWRSVEGFPTRISLRDKNTWNWRLWPIRSIPYHFISLASVYLMK